MQTQVWLLLTNAAGTKLGPSTLQELVAITEQVSSFPSVQSNTVIHICKVWSDLYTVGLSCTFLSQHP